MNKNPLEFLVTLVTVVTDALERMLVGILDGLRNTTDHASPSFHGLVAALLPFATPAPVAYLSARSATQFFEWDAGMAWVLAICVEGLGLVAWVSTAEAYLENKEQRIFWTFLGVASIYEVLLIALNVGLMVQDGAGKLYAFVLLLVCLLPALSAFFFGYNKLNAEARIAKAKAEKQAEEERLRQERRADRKEAQALKTQYAADAKQEALKKDNSFRKH